MMIYSTEASMGWRFQANLPESIVGVEYAENNHHIKLINKWGQELKLDANHMVKYSCDVCGDYILASSNHGVLKCQHCGEVMEPTWGTAQLCFVPNEETGFTNCADELESLDESPTDPQMALPQKDEEN